MLVLITVDIQTFWKVKFYTFETCSQIQMEGSNSMTNKFYLIKTIPLYTQEERDDAPKIINEIITTIIDQKLKLKSHNRT